MCVGMRVYRSRKNLSRSLVHSFSLAIFLSLAWKQKNCHIRKHPPTLWQMVEAWVEMQNRNKNTLYSNAAHFHRQIALTLCIQSNEYFLSAHHTFFSSLSPFSFWCRVYYFVCFVDLLGPFLLLFLHLSYSSCIVKMDSVCVCVHVCVCKRRIRLNMRTQWNAQPHMAIQTSE